MLRFGIGQAYIKEKQFDNAAIHLKKAIEHDHSHTASWKLLGKAYSELGNPDEAIETYTQGIKLAEEKGDLQAAKEMTVFLKRLLKSKKV